MSFEIALKDICSKPIKQDIGIIQFRGKLIPYAKLEIICFEAGLSDNPEEYINESIKDYEDI